MYDIYLEDELNNLAGKLNRTTDTAEILRLADEYAELWFVVEWGMYPTSTH